MKDINYIKEGLYLQHLPVYETDIQHIHNIRFTVNQAQDSLKAYPTLNNEVPITIVDKRLLL